MKKDDGWDWEKLPNPNVKQHHDKLWIKAYDRAIARGDDIAYANYLGDQAINRQKLADKVVKELKE